MKLKGWFLGVLLLMLGTLLFVNVVSTNATTKPTNSSSLLNSSDAQIAQAALNYTNQFEAVLSGTPLVVLNRRITDPQLIDLGLNPVPIAINQPPMQLIILKGDLDGYAVIPGGLILDRNAKLKVEYIAYVYDLAAGAPTGLLTSAHGGMFRKALNNPNLPDDNPGNLTPFPTLTPGGLINITPTVPYVSNHLYGEVAPGVETVPTAHPIWNR